MYYFEKNENEVVKYEVTLYKEHLLDLRDRLIKDFSSTISIHNYSCLNFEDNLETDNIKDFKIDNSNNISFKYYIYPELVNLIDMLMCGNVSSIQNIINYEQKQINSNQLLNENYMIKICNDISNKFNVIFNYNDLKYYLETYGLKINNDDYMFIKEEILSCISFKKIGSIKLNQFYKVLDFLDLESKDLINTNLNSSKNKVKTRKKSSV